MPATEVNNHALSGDAELDNQIELWLKWDRNAVTRAEVQRLVEHAEWATLRQRLLQRLNFGTAGLRGCMRAGFDSMNELVIVQTAQGLCEYIVQQFPLPEQHVERGIVFGYDGRYNSKRFAELSASVFINRGFKVWLYGKMVATPFVPFAILQLKCLAGVMVTASHNPKEDNGYKVYWSNGAQIIGPHDKGIQAAILENLTPLESSWQTDALEQSDLLADPYEQLFPIYFDKIMSIMPEMFVNINSFSELRFVYTAMHGVGYPFVKEAFRVGQMRELVVVEQQRDADPEFPTVKFPNPEEGKSALELSIQKAEQENCRIILANDPDADRLAVAEKDLETGTWKVFNGNEIAALLAWWCMQYLRSGFHDPEISDCYMLASTVSSKILRPMSVDEGFHFEETLTGFKWMGNRAAELLKEGKQVIFAFEEAIGFMVTPAVLDKDGISAAIHLASLACYLDYAGKRTLKEHLNDMYSQYGYHCTNCSYLFCHEPTTIKRIFERLRNFDNGQAKTYPKSILNGTYTVKHVRDLTNGVDTSQPDGKATLPVSSSSQMITFTFDNGVVVTLRTSGTEPKIKYYAELCAKPEEKDYEQLRAKLDEMVVAIVDEFLQPKLNGLIPRTD